MKRGQQDVCKSTLHLWCRHNPGTYWLQFQFALRFAIWGLNFLFVFSLSFLLLLGRYNCAPKGWSDFSTLVEGGLYILGVVSISKICAATVTYTVGSCCQLKLGQLFTTRKPLPSAGICFLLQVFVCQQVLYGVCAFRAQLGNSAGKCVPCARYLVTPALQALLITKQKRKAHCSFSKYGRSRVNWE